MAQPNGLFLAPMRDVLGMRCSVCGHVAMQHQAHGCGYAHLQKLQKNFKPRGIDEKPADGFRPLAFKEYCECAVGFDTLRMIAEGFHRLREAVAH